MRMQLYSEVLKKNVGDFEQLEVGEKCWAKKCSYNARRHTSWGTKAFLGCFKVSLWFAGPGFLIATCKPFYFYVKITTVENGFQPINRQGGESRVPEMGEGDGWKNFGGGLLIFLPWLTTCIKNNGTRKIIYWYTNTCLYFLLEYHRIYKLEKWSTFTFWTSLPIY